MDISKVNQSFVCSKCGGSLLTPSDNTSAKVCECWKGYTEDATKYFTTKIKKKQLKRFLAGEFAIYHDLKESIYPRDIDWFLFYALTECDGFSGFE